MSIRLEKFLILFVTLAVCALILAWSFFLNFGKIQISSNQPFEIYNLAKQPLVCETKECFFKVPIGTFNVTFQAEEFKNITAQIEIRRFQTTEATLNFEYQPVLIKSGNITNAEESDFKIKFVTDAQEKWDKYLQNVAYFKTEGRKTELMLYNKPIDEFVKITNFYNFEDAEIFWGEIGDKLIVRNNQDFYLVDLTQKLKQKINFTSDKQKLLFSADDSQLIYTNDQQLYLYDFTTKTSTFLDLNIAIENLVWQDETNLLYFSNTEEETEFYKYNFKNAESQLLFTTNLLDPQNLEVSSNGQNLNFESNGKAYELRLIQE